MKCNSFLPPMSKPGKRKQTGKYAPLAWWCVKDFGPAFAHSETAADLLAKGYTRCDGKIIAKVDIEYGPHRHDEEVAASYECEACGQTFHMLPTNDKDAISRLLTDAVAALDFEQYWKNEVAKREAHDRATQEMLERYRAKV